MPFISTVCFAIICSSSIFFTFNGTTFPSDKIFFALIIYLEDKGPIIYQEEIPVYANDNAEKLSKRVLRLEHKTYKKIISYLINDKIIWNGNKPEIRKIYND